MRGRCIFDRAKAATNVKGCRTIGDRAKAYFAECLSRLVQQAINKYSSYALLSPIAANVDMAKPPDISPTPIGIYIQSANGD